MKAIAWILFIVGITTLGVFLERQHQRVEQQIQKQAVKEAIQELTGAGSDWKAKSLKDAQTDAYWRVVTPDGQEFWAQTYFDDDKKWVTVRSFRSADSAKDFLKAPSKNYS